MKEIKLEQISVKVYDNYDVFSSQEVALFSATKEICLKAYAPYSNFFVGAAVLLSDGQIYKGNNQENAAYPSGLCAERVALFHASANNPTISVNAIAIVAKKGNELDFLAQPAPPCGSCRQVIAEYEHKFGTDIKVFLLGKKEQVWEFSSMKNLLPLAFSGDFLTTNNKDDFEEKEEPKGAV